MGGKIIGWFLVAGWGQTVMNRKYLSEYKTNGFENVEGWCEPQIFEVIELLDSADINKIGGCLEIGVHHGKLFILLITISP